MNQKLLAICLVVGLIAGLIGYVVGYTSTPFTRTDKEFKELNLRYMTEKEIVDVIHVGLCGGRTMQKDVVLAKVNPFGENDGWVVLICSSGSDPVNLTGLAFFRWSDNTGGLGETVVYPNEGIDTIFARLFGRTP